MARCSGNRRAFGIRFERIADGSWLGDWAFALAEQAARKERYDHTDLSGGIAFGAAYPGCPECSANGISRCGGCARVACWNGDADVTCPFCAQPGTIKGDIDTLSAGGDR